MATKEKRLSADQYAIWIAERVEELRQKLGLERETAGDAFTFIELQRQAEKAVKLGASDEDIFYMLREYFYSTAQQDRIIKRSIALARGAVAQEL